MKGEYDDGKFQLKPVVSYFDDACVQIVKRSNGEVIPYDEPIFIFRARDHLAVPVLKEYLRLCQEDFCTEYQIDAVKARIEVFQKWADDHTDRMKQPGITQGK